MTDAAAQRGASQQPRPAAPLVAAPAQVSTSSLPPSRFSEEGLDDGNDDDDDEESPASVPLVPPTGKARGAAAEASQPSPVAPPVSSPAASPPAAPSPQAPSVPRPQSIPAPVDSPPAEEDRPAASQQAPLGPAPATPAARGAFWEGAPPALIDLRYQAQQDVLALVQATDLRDALRREPAGGPRSAHARRVLAVERAYNSAHETAAAALCRACDAAAAHLYQQPDAQMGNLDGDAHEAWIDLILLARDEDPEPPTQVPSSPRSMDYRITLQIPPGAPINSEVLSRVVRGRRCATHPDAQSRQRQAALGRQPMMAAAAARRFRHVQEAAVIAADDQLRADADVALVESTRRRVEEAAAAADAVSAADVRSLSAPTAGWVTVNPIDGSIRIGGVLMRSGFAPTTANGCCLDSLLQLTGFLNPADRSLKRRRSGFRCVWQLARDACDLLRLRGDDVIGALDRSYLDCRLRLQEDAYIDPGSLDKGTRAVNISNFRTELAYQLAGWGAASESEFRGMTTDVGLAALALHLKRTIVVVDTTPRPVTGSGPPPPQRAIVDVYGQWLGTDLFLRLHGDHYVPLFRAGRQGHRPAVPRWITLVGPPSAASTAAAADLVAARAAAAAAEEQLHRNAGQAARAAAASARRAPPAAGGASAGAAGPHCQTAREQQANERRHNANVRRDQGTRCDVCNTLTSVHGSTKGEILKCSGPGADQLGYCTGARHAHCRHEDQAAHPAYPGHGPFFCSVSCRVAREAAPREDDDDDSAPTGSERRAGPVGGPSAGPVRHPRVAHNDRQHIDDELLAAVREVDLVLTYRDGTPPMLTDIPGASRRQLSSLYAEACKLIDDNKDDTGPYKLMELFAYLLLVKPSHKESKHRRMHQIVNRRFKRLTVQHDVRGLLAYAASRRQEVIEYRRTNKTEKLNASSEEQAAKNAADLISRADLHAGEGYISRAFRVMAQEPPAPGDVAVQKLAQLSRPAGAPISDTFRNFAPPGQAFSEAESPRDEKELADELLKALASSKSAAGGPNGITGRHLRGMLLDSEDALLGTLHVLDKYANGQVPDCIAASMRMSLLVALRKPSPAAPDNGVVDAASASVPVTSPPAAVGIRPIAMGQMMRRLAGKMLLRLHMKSYRRSVGDAQLGLEKCAAELGFHAATLKLQTTTGPKCILMWDIEHAFGSAERANGLEEMTRCVPEAVPFARSVYGGDAGELLYTDPETGAVRSFFSRQGFDQGCPQAGPLFCFSYKPALVDVSGEFPDVLVSAYYDDSPLTGTPERVAEAYNYMLREGGPLQRANMRNHPEKTHVWSPVPLTAAQRAAFPVGTRFEEPEGGIIMWGCPIGSDAFIRRTLDDAVTTRFKPAVDGGPLDQLHAQNSMACMRMGVNARFDNLLRVVPPRILAEAAATWDDNVLSYVERFVGSSLPRDAQIKVTQPLCNGGLGLRSKTQLMHVAFLSAWLACRTLIWERFPSLRAALRDTSDAAAAPPVPQALVATNEPPSSASPGALAADLRDAFSNAVTNVANEKLLLGLLGARGLGDFIAPDACPEDFDFLQKKLSKNVYAAAKEALLQQTDSRGRALILSASGTGSSAWLTAQRGWGPDFVMPNQHMRLAISFRLGLDLPQLRDAGVVGGLCPNLQCSQVNADGNRVYLEPADRHEACTGICDAKGDHILSCQFGHHGRIGRHNAIVNVLARMIRASFSHRVHVITDQSVLKQHMRRFDQPGMPPSKHHIPDWRVIWHTLGHDDDVGDAVVTGFNKVSASGSVTGASALKIQQDKYKQYKSAVLSRPAPVTKSQLTAFAMDSAGYLAPHGNAYLKKLGGRKAAITSSGVADSSLSRKSQSQRAAIYRQHMTQAVSVTLMRAQMHVILQAAYNGHQRNGTPCAGVPVWARPQYFDASWATAYNATHFC